MPWFLIALVAPTLWAVVNHIDKYLLSKHFKGSNIGALMIFSTLISVIVLPVLYAINPSVADIGVWNAGLLVFVGIVSALAVWLYLKALDDEEASIVVPIFQTIPIFGFVFAYFFLGELLSPMQIVGCLLVVFGAAAITIEIDIEQKVRWKMKTLLLMLGSSLLFAFYMTVFKVAALGENFSAALFWENIGLLIVAVSLLSVSEYRNQFMKLIQHNPNAMFSLNIGSELLTVLGNIATNYALLLAPVALVLVISGFQPLMVFFIGIFVTLFLPNIGEEKLSKKHLVHKFLAIAVICIGSGLIQ